MTAGRPPNLKLERELLRAGNCFVAGCDEVGRGSLGGPVSVGMVVVNAATRRPPAGLRDSKLLAPQSASPSFRGSSPGRVAGRSGMRARPR